MFFWWNSIEALRNNFGKSELIVVTKEESCLMYQKMPRLLAEEQADLHV